MCRGNVVCFTYFVFIYLFVLWHMCGITIMYALSQTLIPDWACISETEAFVVHL